MNPLLARGPLALLLFFFGIHGLASAIGEKGRTEAGGRSPIELCEICEGSTPGAIRYEFTDYITQKSRRGFYLAKPIIDLTDFRHVEFLTKAWVKPIEGMAISFSTTGKSKATAWKDAPEQDRLLILFRGAPKGAIAKRELAIIVRTKGDKLWVAMPVSSHEERVALQDEIDKIDKSIKN